MSDQNGSSDTRAVIICVKRYFGSFPGRPMFMLFNNKRPQRQVGLAHSVRSVWQKRNDTSDAYGEGHISVVAVLSPGGIGSTLYPLRYSAMCWPFPVRRIDRDPFTWVFKASGARAARRVDERARG